MMRFSLLADVRDGDEYGLAMISAAGTWDDGSESRDEGPEFSDFKVECWEGYGPAPLWADLPSHIQNRIRDRFFCGGFDSLLRREWVRCGTPFVLPEAA